MAPNGVSIGLPPAKGLEGSAVWQLAQSPATVSTSPLVIVSLEGSAPAFRLNALHKARLGRIVRPPHRHPCIDRPPAPCNMAQKPQSRRFAPPIFRDTTAKRESVIEHEIAFCVETSRLARFVVPQVKKPT